MKQWLADRPLAAGPVLMIGHLVLTTAIGLALKLTRLNDQLPARLLYAFWSALALASALAVACWLTMRVLKRDRPVAPLYWLAAIFVVQTLVHYAVWHVVTVAAVSGLSAACGYLGKALVEGPDLLLKTALFKYGAFWSAVGAAGGVLLGRAIDRQRVIPGY